VLLLKGRFPTRFSDHRRIPAIIPAPFLSVALSAYITRFREGKPPENPRGAASASPLPQPELLFQEEVGNLDNQLQLLRVREWYDSY
jgi:hypothetical protein